MSAEQLPAEEIVASLEWHSACDETCPHPCPRLREQQRQAEELIDRVISERDRYKLAAEMAQTSIIELQKDRDEWKSTAQNLMGDHMYE
jgi:hypothetical protein